MHARLDQQQTPQILQRPNKILTSLSRKHALNLFFPDHDRLCHEGRPVYLEPDVVSQYFRLVLVVVVDEAGGFKLGKDELFELEKALEVVLGGHRGGHKGVCIERTLRGLCREIS